MSVRRLEISAYINLRNEIINPGDEFINPISRRGSRFVIPWMPWKKIKMKINRLYEPYSYIVHINIYVGKYLDFYLEKSQLTTTYL